MLYYRSQIPYNNKILKQGINCLKLFWLFVFGNIFDNICYIIIIFDWNKNNKEDANQFMEHQKF